MLTNAMFCEGLQSATGKRNVSQGEIGKRKRGSGRARGSSALSLLRCGRDDRVCRLRGRRRLGSTLRRMHPREKFLGSVGAALDCVRTTLTSASSIGATSGANDGNRTRAICLGSRSSAIELHSRARHPCHRVRKVYATQFFSWIGAFPAPMRGRGADPREYTGAHAAF